MAQKKKVRFAWANEEENQYAEQIYAGFEVVFRYCKRHEQLLIGELAEDIAVHGIHARRADQASGEKTLLGVPDVEGIVAIRRAKRQSIEDALKACAAIPVEERQGFVGGMQTILETADGVLDDAIAFERAWKQEHGGVEFDESNPEHAAWEEQYDHESE